VKRSRAICKLAQLTHTKRSGSGYGDYGEYELDYGYDQEFDEGNAEDGAAEYDEEGNGEAGVGGDAEGDDGYQGNSYYGNAEDPFDEGAEGKCGFLAMACDAAFPVVAIVRNTAMWLGEAFDGC
jgi:hypothetical protein